jgi:hypothetical protein
VGYALENVAKRKIYDVCPKNNEKDFKKIIEHVCNYNLSPSK